MHHSTLVTKRLFGGILFAVIFTLSLLVFAQNEADILLFVDEGYLIVHNAAAEAISLEGFEMSVSTGNAQIFTTPITTRFDIFLDNYLVAAGTCLIYLYDEQSELPPQCQNEILTRVSRVGPGDRFWFDEDGNRRRIAIFNDGQSTLQGCQAQLDVCPIYWSVDLPSPTLEPPEDIADIPAPVSIIPRTPQVQIPGTDGGAITALSWNQSGDILVTGHSGGAVCIWNTTGVTVRVLSCDSTLHTSSIEAVDLQRVGNEYIATVSSDGTIGIWSLENSNETEPQTLSLYKSYPNSTAVSHLDWHPTEDILLLVTTDRISLWDLDTATIIRNLNITEANVASWRRDGRYIAAITRTGVSYIVDSQNIEGNVTLNEFDGEGLDIGWNPVFERFATLDTSGTIRSYNYTPPAICGGTNCSYTTLGQNLQNLFGFQFSQDGTNIAIGLPREIHVMEAQPPHRLLHRYGLGDTNNASTLTAITWNTDGSALAAGDERGNLYIWQVEEDAPVRLQQLRTLPVTDAGRAVGIAWSPLGDQIAVVDADRFMSVWNISNANTVYPQLAHSDVPIAIDWNEENVIATGGCGPMVKIWELDLTVETFRLPLDTVYCATSVDFRPGEFAENSESVLAIVDEQGVLHLYEWRTKERLSEKAFRTIFNAIEWDENGEQIGSTSENGLLTVFSIDDDYQPTEIFVRQPEPGMPLTDLVWSPSGEEIATSSEAGWIAIWDLTSGVEGVGYEGSYLLEGHEGGVISISWNHDYNLIASVGQDNRLIVWDGTTGQRLAQMVLEQVPVQVRWSVRDQDPKLAVLDSGGDLTIWQFR